MLIGKEINNQIECTSETNVTSCKVLKVTLPD